EVEPALHAVHFSGCATCVQLGIRLSTGDLKEYRAGRWTYRTGTPTFALFILHQEARIPPPLHLTRRPRSLTILRKSLEGCAMESSLSLANNEQTAFRRIVGLMLTAALLWLTLGAANISAEAQTPQDVANSSAVASSPADWSQLLRDNMQRWNPYE